MMLTVWLARTQEVSFYLDDHQPKQVAVVLCRMGEADDDFGDLDAAARDWRSHHLPHAVAIAFDRKDKPKKRLRRWLAANARHPWAFCDDGARFANEQDAALCKLFWGG